MIIYDTKIYDKANISQFCWRSEWISPFESPWSIFEKFKYANCIGAKEIMRCFSNKYVQNLKKIAPSYYNIVTLHAFDDEKLKMGFNIDIVSNHNMNLDLLINFLPNRMLRGSNQKFTKYYLREKIAFCPICLGSGFHSIIHQFKIVHSCPYHGVPLEDFCPECNRSIPFELSDKFTSAPFQCVCGYKYLKFKECKPIIDWTYFPMESIKCPKVKKWLNLTDEQRTKLNKCWLFSELELEKYEGVLDIFLKVSDCEYEMDSKLKYNLVYSSTRINKQSSSDVNDLSKYYPNVDCSLFNKRERELIKYEAFQKLMYSSYMNTISGVANKLRKTIFMKHKKCINRLKNRNLIDGICPYAYTYIHWRSYLQNYPDLIVDNRHRPRREFKNYMEFPPITGQYLDNLYDYIKDTVDDITAVNRDSLKWIFNRLIVFFSIHYLNNWLANSQIYAEQKISKFFFLNEFNNIPFFVLTMSFNDHERHEFHWLTKKELNKINLICPFTSIRSKREKGRSERIMRYKNKIYI